MKLQFESLQIGGTNPSINAYLREDPGFEPYWHYHPEFELTYIIKGAGLRFVGDHVAPFKDGDLVLIGPNLPHQWVSEDDGSKLSRALVIHFSSVPHFDLPEFKHLRQILNAAEYGTYFSNPTDEVREAMQRLPNLKPLLQLTSLIEILDSLNEHINHKLSEITFKDERTSNQAINRIATVRSYLLGNLEQPLSVSDLADVCNITVPSFCRWFKQSFNESFVSYLNRLRVDRACQLLIRTDQPIGEIAFETGFESISNFNRFFKRMRGASPRDYRQNNLFKLT